MPGVHRKRVACGLDLFWRGRLQNRLVGRGTALPGRVQNRVNNGLRAVLTVAIEELVLLRGVVAVATGVSTARFGGSVSGQTSVRV